MSNHNIKHDHKQREANRLIKEKSPYLLQHANNPVNWYPWSEEAFLKAEREDKPVFLSIGYSTCHWCHVMEKESFEDEEVAGLLNKDFVAIKVDREERPDLDQVYMNVCQAITGQGGWPLTIFMTPAKKPFFAATYLPKHTRMGISGLVEFLPKVAEIWQLDRQKVEQSAEEIVSALRRQAEGPDLHEGQKEKSLHPEEILDQGFRGLQNTFDEQYGGFGGAPKFPSPHQLIFLLRYFKRSGSKEALQMAITTLQKMYAGGIFDQLGYGMHRYSVDRHWLVPHFEKMLYDQATTIEAALEAYQASGDPQMASFSRKIMSYVLDELQSVEGGFYSAEDADSEGEEGVFYVFSRQEFIKLLGQEKGALLADYYGVTDAGNFEKGKSVLHRPYDDRDFCLQNKLTEEQLQSLLKEGRAVLLKARSERERPFLDDKIITAWNGMIIAALAKGSEVLGDRHYADAAGRAADFIFAKMTAEGGQLYRRYRDNEAAIPAFLEDYAFLARGLLDLYQATSDPDRLEQAKKVVAKMDPFLNQDKGKLKFSTTGEDLADLPLYVEAYDGAVPSGVSAGAEAYLRLGFLTGDKTLIRKGKLLLKAQSQMLKRFPTGHTAMLTVLDFALEHFSEA